MPYTTNPSQRGPLRRFFSGLWGLITWLRVAITNLIFLAIVIIIVVAISKSEPDRLPSEFALHLAPSGQLVDERHGIDPLTTILGDTDAHYAETLVADVVTAIDRARDDERINHLVLDLNYLAGGGISKLDEIARSLIKFKDSGKTISAMSDQYNQDQYYLASFADTVYLHDMGSVLITGYGSYRSYFKDAIDRLAIKFHVFRSGEFKDAVEPYIRNNMSEASRTHNSQWLSDLWGYYSQRVETERVLPTGSLNQIINNAASALANAGGSPAIMAKNAGLVDEIISRQQLRAQLIDRFGYDEDNDSYQAVDWYRYLDHTEHHRGFKRDTIGVIVASGTILDGDQPSGSIGSESMIQLLREARKAEDVKALVIRIDSGGGSAFASELIRSEIELTRDSGIPVVVSMGSVAASGGYWIAAGADEIWAMPTTITGSIGVFGLIPGLDASLEKLGIHSDGVGTTDMADAFHLDRPLNPLLAHAMQMNVDALYQRFIHTVADARGLSTDAVDRMGQGRVWSGTRALELGLVDKLGTLQEAINAAAGFASLEQWDTRVITRPLSPGEQLLQQLMGVSASLGLNTTEIFPSLSRLEQLAQSVTQGSLEPLFKAGPTGEIYAHCIACKLDPAR